MGLQVFRLADFSYTANSMKPNLNSDVKTIGFCVRQDKKKLRLKK